MQSIHLLKKKKKTSLASTSFPLTAESFFPEMKPFHGISLAGSLRHDREDLNSGGRQDAPSTKQEDRASHKSEGTQTTGSRAYWRHLHAKPAPPDPDFGTEVGDLDAL